MARVELDHPRSVRAGGASLPGGVDRGVSQRRDDDVSRPEPPGHRVERCLAAELCERPVGLGPRAVRIHPSGSGLRVGPVRPALFVANEAAEAVDERLGVEVLDGHERAEVDTRARLHLTDRQPAEGVSDDDRVRLRPQQPRIVGRRQPDLLARQVGGRDFVPPTLKLLGDPAEAPASVPGTVHEDEPCHGASILHSMLGHILTAIVTPFREDESIDFDAFQRLAGHLVENGSDGIVVAGTTGESPNLTDEERLDLFRAAIEAVGDRATVVAGTGTYSTRHSVQLSERAHELGADALLVVTPYYNKPPQRGIVAHFEAIARTSDKPIVVYNIPARVVVNIEPETISRLAEIETVRAVKQANGDLGQARHIVDTGLVLYAGDDALVQPFVELGGAGGICVHTHVVGPQVAAQVSATLAGDVERGRELDRELAPAYDLLGVQTNPLPIKAALNLLGHGVGGHRLPLPAPTEEEVAAVRACLERLGLLVAA